MHPVAPSCAPVALVDQTEVVRKRRRRGFRALMLTRLLVLGSALGGVSLGVTWLKHESPHPVAVEATRESPLVEARSLQPLLETANSSQLAPYAMQKDAAEPFSPLFIVQSQHSAEPSQMPVWLVADGAGSAERLRQILRDRGARQMGQTVRFAMLTVGELLGMTGKTWSASMATSAASENEASALLLTFYLYHLDRGGDGAGIRAFRQALEQRMPLSRAVTEFILAGRSVGEFEAEMGRLYGSAGIELHFTRRGGAVFKP